MPRITGPSLARNGVDAPPDVRAARARAVAQLAVVSTSICPLFLTSEVSACGFSPWSLLQNPSRAIFLAVAGKVICSTVQVFWGTGRM